MGKRVRSAKGETVDFDLMKIKQKLATNPAPVNVQEREEFIDSKVRRRRKQKASPIKLDVDVKPSVVNDDEIDEPDLIDDESSKIEDPVEQPAEDGEVKARPINKK